MKKICIKKSIVVPLGILVLLLISIGVYLYSTNRLRNETSTLKTRAEAPKTTNKIFNGERVKPNEFPYFVKLEILTLIDKNSNTTGICSGALISEDFVLTVKHCIRDLLMYKNGRISVLIGTDNYVATDVSLKGHYYDTIEYVGSTEGIFIPPEQKTITNEVVYTDLALIKLRSPAKGIPTLSLPPSSKSLKYLKLNIKNGLSMTVVGNGTTNDTLMTHDEYLLKTQIVLKDRLTDKINRVHHFVAGSEGGNTCHGDSGGPVIYIHKNVHYLFAITSYGDKCDLVEDGFYMSIAYYMKWITEVTGLLPESGTVVGEKSDIESYPSQKELGGLCEQITTVEGCIKHDLICAWNTYICYTK